MPTRTRLWSCSLLASPHLREDPCTAGPLLLLVINGDARWRTFGRRATSSRPFCAHPGQVLLSLPDEVPYELTRFYVASIVSSTKDFQLRPPVDKVFNAQNLLHLGSLSILPPLGLLKLYPNRFYGKLCSYKIMFQYYWFQNMCHSRNVKLSLINYKIIVN